MTITEILTIGRIYRLYKLIQPTGTIYCIESLRGYVWELVYSTVDTGFMAGELTKWGVASDSKQALRLLNR